MYPAQVTIPGVDGQLKVTYSFWKGFRYAVGGVDVHPVGFIPRRLVLPAPNGAPMVEVVVRSGFFRTHPEFVTDGSHVAPAPEPPLAHVLLALSPLLGVLVFFGALGFALAFGGAAIGMHLLRTDMAKNARIAATLGVTAVVLGLDIAMLMAVRPLT